jgi:hypothetical protein
MGERMTTVIRWKKWVWFHIFVGLMFILSPIACTQEYAMAEQKPSLIPQWTKGESWRVEYLLKVPSTVMGPVTQPVPPRRSVWRYEVTMSTDRKVELELTEEDGDGHYRLFFEPGDLVLREILLVEGSAQEEVDETVPNSPYFGWTQSQPVIIDWPFFPKVAPGNRLRFKTAADEEVDQTTELQDTGGLEVLLTYVDQDSQETTRSRQVWFHGEPWWRTASVEFEYADSQPPAVVLSIQGKRMP